MYAWHILLFQAEALDLGSAGEITGSCRSSPPCFISLNICQPRIPNRITNAPVTSAQHNVKPEVLTRCRTTTTEPESGGETFGKSVSIVEA